jgi:heme A synthase
MPPFKIIATVFLLLSSLVACGGAGACVVDSTTGMVGWETCYNNYSPDDCDAKGETLALDVEHFDSSCSEQGFTKECDGEYGSRRSTYECL